MEVFKSHHAFRHVAQYKESITNRVKGFIRVRLSSKWRQHHHWLEPRLLAMWPFLSYLPISLQFSVLREEPTSTWNK